MRLLIVLRHAKSSWADERLDDHDRPLAARGRKAAVRVGRWLADGGLRPDLVLCSTARRARETVDLVRPAFEQDVPVRFLDALYEAEPDALLEAVRRAPDEVSKLLLIGHNPGLEGLARRLAPADGSRQHREMMAKFPTAAAAVIGVAAPNWRRVAWGSGQLQVFVRPKDLGD